MSTPRVSVVLNFLDTEPYIAEAIESVLAQSYTDWELCLVDDGSTDGSTAIAKRYAASHERINYIDHPGHVNRGASAARNAGAARTYGELLAFIDSDDVWEPGKLTEQVAVLDEHPEVALVCGAHLLWHSWAGPDSQSDEILQPGAGATDVVLHPPRALLHLYPLGPTHAAGTDLLMRRAVFDAVGGFEERFRGMYDDQALLTKVYLEYPVFISSRAWFKYRQRPTSIVHTVGSRRNYLRYRWAFFRWFSRYAADRHAPGTIRKHVQQMQAWLLREIWRERLDAWRARFRRR